MLHGQQYEAVAKQTFVAKMDLQNQTCCLFIDSKYNYLAASPYSIVRKNAADNFFSLFLVDDDDGVFYLKQNCYYMHVQSQLNVCKKGKCFFVDFTFTDYWNGCILSKL